MYQSRLRVREGTQVRKIGKGRPAAIDMTYLGPFNWPGAYLINRINVPLEHRGKGIASQMLKDVCEEADRAEVTLVLEVIPGDEFGMTRAQLEAWYYKHGFEPSHLSKLPGQFAASGPLWVRIPQTSALRPYQQAIVDALQDPNAKVIVDMPPHRRHL